MAAHAEDVRSNLSSLIARRDIIEAEILNLHAELKKQNVTMTEPLVDGEGYPRSDIDVYLVRHLRHEIICKENDCKALMKEIEQGLYTLHAEEKGIPNNACMNGQATLRPFARVDLVDDNSPAQKADLRVGDLLIKFGTLKHRNFGSLTEVAKLVTESLRRPIHVSVLRGDHLVPLILVPDEWNGNGYLGCRIIPFDS